MQLLDGKLAAQAIKEDLKKKTAALQEQGKRSPHLAAILVGTDGASETYVASKVKTCAEIGFESTLKRFPSTISEEELLREIEELNNNADVDGILVQLPVPKHISDDKVINAIGCGIPMPTTQHCSISALASSFVSIGDGEMYLPLSVLN